MFIHKSVIVKRVLHDMDQVVKIVKLNQFNLLKKEVDEFGQLSKILDRQNRRLGDIAEVLNDQNDVYECIVVLYSVNVNKEKTDQVTSVVLSKFAKKDI